MVYDDEDRNSVFADCVFDNCDTPAARKISGTVIPLKLSISLLSRYQTQVYQRMYVPWCAGSSLTMTSRTFRGTFSECVFNCMFYHTQLIFCSSSTLGIQVSYADVYQPQEVIPVDQIVAPLGLIEVQSRIARRKLWITISFDHVRDESTSFGLIASELNMLQAGTEPDDLDDTIFD